VLAAQENEAAERVGAFEEEGGGEEDHRQIQGDLKGVYSP